MPQRLCARPKGALAKRRRACPEGGALAKRRRACPKGGAYYQFGTRERQKPPPLLLSVLLIPAIKKNEACIFAAALDGRGRQGYNKGVMCGDGMRLRAGGDPAGAGARGALWWYCGRCLRKILPKAGKYRFPYGEKRVIIDTVKEKVIISNIDKHGLDDIETSITEYMIKEKKKYYSNENKN